MWLDRPQPRGGDIPGIRSGDKNKIRFVFIVSPAMSTKANRATNKRKADAISQAEEAVDQPKQKKQKLNLELISENSPENVTTEENIREVSNTNEVVGEYFELPPEILVSIFSSLAMKDLSRASCVCQHWWLCSKDESLAWSFLTMNELIEMTYYYRTAFDKSSAIST